MEKAKIFGRRYQQLFQVVFSSLLLITSMKVTFHPIIKRFASKGEKTGWTYIEVTAAVASQLKPGVKKSFRVKGTLDRFRIEKVSLLPMGEGNFIMALNKAMRTNIKKLPGAKVSAILEADERQLQLDKDLLNCLKDEPQAFTAFNKLPPSHQRWFSKWITDAKTSETKARRIAKAVSAMLNNKSFGETLKS
jgi:hypothetical protein